jgi:hypothetical protein
MSAWQSPQQIHPSRIQSPVLTLDDASLDLVVSDMLLLIKHRPFQVDDFLK